MQFGGLSADLLGYLNRRDVPTRFIVDDFGLLCDSAQLPGFSAAVTESVDFTGVTQNFVHTQIFTPLNLSFYVDDEYRALKFLNHWMEYAFSGNGTNTNFYASPGYNYRVKYPSQYKANGCKVFKFEKNFNRILEYSFIGLFPSALNSTQVRYGSAEITKVSCEFRYDRYIPGSIFSFDFVRNQGNNLNSTLDTILGGFNLVDRFLNSVNL
jgi:hypothetical protein